MKRNKIAQCITCINYIKSHTEYTEGRYKRLKGFCTKNLRKSDVNTNKYIDCNSYVARDNPFDNLKEIVMKGEVIEIPEEFALSKEKPILKIRTPRFLETRRLMKNGSVKIETNYRRKYINRGFIQKGYIEINDILFRLKEIKK